MFSKPSFSDPGILGWGAGGFAVCTAFLAGRAFMPRRTTLEAAPTV
jgi:hypothetical protein